MFSDYFNTLSGDVKTRYLSKIAIIGGIDPYTLTKLTNVIDVFPKIDQVEISDYLIHKTSFYTKKEFKAYKTLDSYKTFLSNWVKNIGGQVLNERCVVVGQVLHSQRLREKPLTAWVIAEKDGEILSAHCTCIAGLGETCTHVGALLFAVEHYVQFYEPKSVTDVKAYWMQPGKAGEPSTSRNIDYTSGKKMANIAKGKTQPSIREAAEDESVPLTSQKEVISILQQMKEANLECAAMSVVEPFHEAYSESTSTEEENNVLTKLFKQEYLNCSLEELIEIGKSINLILTEELCQCVAKLTKNQSTSHLWFHFRQGRITASIFKEATRTNIERPSLSLLKKICYPTTRKIKTPAILHGCAHEKDAIEDFKRIMKHFHENLTTTKIGLILHPSYPQVGASPDSLSSCFCCGVHPIEAKCPFCAKDASFEDVSYLKNFCLLKRGTSLLGAHRIFKCKSETDATVCLYIIYSETKIYAQKLEICPECVEKGAEILRHKFLEKEPTNFSLDKDHKYFYQCQMQMALLEAENCFFVVWSRTEIYIERLDFDEEFWTANFRKIQIFFEKCVLPELLGKFFSRKKSVYKYPTSVATSSTATSSAATIVQTSYCLCKGPDDGTPMIACQSDSCQIEWFHMRCVNLTPDDIPQSWFCQFCS